MNVVRKQRQIAAGGFALVLAAVLAGAAAAGPGPHPGAGSLDTSFGGTGYVTTTLSSFAFPAGVTSYDGGKTVVVGGLFNSTGDFFVVRYNKDGSLDSSFGSGGVVTTDFGGGSDTAFAVTTEGNKIVVAGTTTVDNSTFSVALARYNPNGSLDPSFGSGGEVVSTLNGNLGVNAVAVSGHSIVVEGYIAGTAGDFNFLLTRYRDNGSLDASFGTGGVVTTDFNGGDDLANGLAFMGDKIVAAGYVHGTSGTQDFGLARYNNNGTLDPSFGAGGKVQTDFFGSDDNAKSVAVDGNTILALGDAEDGTVTVGNATNTLRDFAAAEYDNHGHLVPSFGTGGKATFRVEDFDQGWGGGFGPGDSVVIGGSAETYASNLTGSFAVVRLTKNGDPDPKFGTGGATTTNVGATNGAFGAALTPDNKIVVDGIADSAVAVVRYLDN